MPLTTFTLREKKAYFVHEILRFPQLVGGPTYWVVCSTPHALSPNALSPHTLSTDGLSENLSYSEKLWIKFGLLDVV